MLCLDRRLSAARCPSAPQRIGQSGRVNRAASERRAGRIVIDWVDASEPSAAAGSSNFGWSLKDASELPDDERLVRLLRDIADSIESERRT